MEDKNFTAQLQLSNSSMVQRAFTPEELVETLI